jgi:hypothetical protein
MLIDCDTCTMRGLACSDCVVTVLLGIDSQHRAELDTDERQALGVLAEAGLVPPLRLVAASGDAAAALPVPDPDDFGETPRRDLPGVRSAG